MVAGQDNYILGIVAVDEADILVDSISCAGIPCLACCGLVRRQYVYAPVSAVKPPGLTVAYVFVEHQRLILRQHAYGVNTGIYAVGEREVDYSVLASVGNCRLCHLLRQRIQTASLTTGKQHGNALFFNVIHIFPPVPTF